MIKKFSTSYAGFIDMENLGLEGTPANDRRYSNERLATVFDKTQAIAQVCDQWGYDTLWMAEHHFQPEGYECIPNLIMLGLHLAQCNGTCDFAPQVWVGGKVVGPLSAADTIRLARELKEKL